MRKTPNNQLSKKGVPKMRDFVRRAIFQISLSNKHPINGHKNTTGDKSLALFGHSSHYSYLPSLHSKYNNNNIDSHNSDEVKTMSEENKGKEEIKKKKGKIFGDPMVILDE